MRSYHLIHSIDVFRESRKRTPVSIDPVVNRIAPLLGDILSVICLSLSLPSFLEGRKPADKGNSMELSQVERGKARRPSETKVVLPDKKSEKERRMFCMEVISGHSFRPGSYSYKDVMFT